ncbi:membrane protein [Mycolicibacter heraklionensis]|uniref:Membrane protein n=1 Tax=Mycolicibacter heraklionensis TaxID=512402 RepID=A0A9X7WF97_9MYCO|nr:hypothetical protein [Mycolicibacter heraklionensis]KLO29805.1 membrane protein [Mycolicibacter heraklionensis]QZA06782.1 hypothetical protein K3U94_17555 [Mycolicibacter heraklionensis]
MEPPTPSRSAPGGDRLGQEDREVRAAARFAGTIAAVALAFVVIAVLWVGSCDPQSATAGCGRPYRAVLAAGGPVILAAGGLRAFMRTYRVWRARGTWWGWQGAGWFLMTLMLVVLLVSGVPIMGIG